MIYSTDILSRQQELKHRELDRQTTLGTLRSPCTHPGFEPIRTRTPFVGKTEDAGGRRTRSLDIFDFLMHAIPWVLLGIKLYLSYVKGRISP